MSEGCLDCGRGLHDFCGDCECCQPEKEKVLVTKSESNDVGRPLKEPEDVTDKASTGRKRAAGLYPLFPEDPCEWRNSANCGGGKHPIIGCVGGKQQHRHHGPDKNTLKNEPGNVHRICDDCHNIWHSQNNKDYDPSIKHNPRVATYEELIDRSTKVRYCASN